MSAKIFFDNHLAYKYKYDKKKKKPILCFVDKEMMDLCIDVVKALHLKYNTPSDLMLFTLQLLGFTEIQHYTKKALKEKKLGVVALLNEDNSLNCVLQITDKDKKKFLKETREYYTDKKAYLFDNYKEFNVEKILNQ